MSRRRSQQPDFITNLVLLIGRGLWVLVSLPFRALWGRRPSKLNRAYFASPWKMVESNLGSSDAQHRTQAIIDADKLFDRAMRDLGIPGKTFADRLRASESRFSHETYQGLWDAHKLRNQITHEVGYQTSDGQARTAISCFRRGLQAFGAL